MAYQVQLGNEASVLHQVWNAGGTARVTGQASSITTVLLDPLGAVSALPVTKTEIGVTGLYTLAFTPTSLGNWLLTATNPAGTDEASSDYAVAAVGTVVVGGAWQGLTTLALVRQRLSIPTADTSRDALITQLIAEISDQVEVETGREFIEASRTEYYDGSGREVLLLRQGPLVSITSVSSIEYGDDGAGNQTETATIVKPSERFSGGLRSEGDNGRAWIRLRSGFFVPGQRNYKVVYVAGFSTSTAALPAAIVHKATTDVAVEYYLREAAGLMAKTVGDSTINPIPRANIYEARARSWSPFRLRGTVAA
jgi:hypothetical protein